MKPNYREDKATQMAARFLRLRGGGMSHLKLMKLLYLAEREAILKLGKPITFDNYVSMDHGPVLSQTLNILHGDIKTGGPWDKAISVPSNNEVELIGNAPEDKLSEAEEEIIDQIFRDHGSKSRWQLRDYTHSLEEWQNPKGSSIKIEYEDILKAAKRTEAEIAAILDDIESLAYMDLYLE